MNIIRSSIIYIVFILLASCAVNEKTGLIIIQNKTLGPLNNVKIGEKVLAYSVSSGTSINYWYYENIKGKLTVDVLSLKTGQDNWSLNLKPGYWIYITAEYDSQSGDDVVSIAAYNGNSASVPPSEWRDN